MNFNKILGISSPSSDFDKNSFLKSLDIVKKYDYECIYDKDILNESKSYLKGSDLYRKNNLERLLKNNKIDKIIMARGGYGAIRTINILDKELLLNSKKLIIGFSDITVFHAFMNNNNKISLHGPMFAALSRNSYSRDNLFSLLNGKIKSYDIKSLNKKEKKSLSGVLVGGNLAVIASIIGTNYQLDIEDKILFLEDINEPLYKLDRMLMQIILSSKKPRAIILGQFTNCANIEEIKDLFSRLFDIPIYYNLNIGHNDKTDSIFLGLEYNIIDEKLIPIF